MLKTVAPRAWKSANEIIDAVLTHDPGLHLPFYLPNADPPLRPTAFSRAQYHFTTDGMPRSESGTYFPSLSALTSLGNYHVDEGELILWSERTVVNFPVGATILLPEWMPYSFTSVESPGYQMIFSQTCDQGLCEYVQNDFSGEFAVVEPTTEESRRKILWDARAGASLYGTLNELDSLYAWS
jgi:hypothetical protein